MTSNEKAENGDMPMVTMVKQRDHSSSTSTVTLPYLGYRTASSPFTFVDVKCNPEGPLENKCVRPVRLRSAFLYVKSQSSLSAIRFFWSHRGSPICSRRRRPSNTVQRSWNDASEIFRRVLCARSWLFTGTPAQETPLPSEIVSYYVE